MAIPCQALNAYEENAPACDVEALRYALTCAAEPALNEREQVKEPFLIPLQGYHRRVAVVATVPRESPDPLVIDRVTVFWPDRAPTTHRTGEAVRKTREALARQIEGDALVADIARRIDELDRIAA